VQIRLFYQSVEKFAFEFEDRSLQRSSVLLFLLLVLIPTWLFSIEEPVITKIIAIQFLAPAFVSFALLFARVCAFLIYLPDIFKERKHRQS
jgi:hypothetical protein